MTKKKIACIFIGATLFVVMPYLYFVFSNVSKLPPKPDIAGFSPIQKKKLQAAHRKTFFFPTSGNLGNLGMEYHSGADFERAKACYQLAISKNNAGWVWNYYLGFIHREMGESEKAIENFQNVIRKNSNAYHAWFYLGEAHQKSGNFEKAKTAFEKITPWMANRLTVSKPLRIDYFPLDVYSKCQLSQGYLNNNKPGEANQLLAELTSKNKTFGWAYRLQSQVYFNMGDTINGKKAVARANDLLTLTSPVDTLVDKITLKSASELILLKQIDEAEKFRYSEWQLTLINHSLTVLPGNQHVRAKAIMHYLRMNKAEHALPLLQSHFQSFHNDAYALLQVANLLFNKRYFAQSDLYYNRVLELEPQNQEVQLNILLGLVYMGENDKAYEKMDAFVQNSNSNETALENAVTVLFELGDSVKFNTYLTRLKQSFPNNAKAFYYAGKTALQSNNPQIALQFFEMAAQKSKNDLQIFKSYCELLLRSKLWVKAKAELQNTLHYFPNDPVVLETMGTLLVVCPDHQVRNYKAGEEYLERAFFHKDCPPETMVTAGKSLADAWIAIGDHEKARIYLDIAIDWAKSIGVAPEYIEKLSLKRKQLQ